MTSNSELRTIIKHITFMKMAYSLSKLSYDPKHQVGSLIIKNDWTEINSMGYNGAYRGSPNERYSLDTGKSKFIHAEMNALIFSTLSREQAENYTLYVTLTPCEMCSRMIVNKGIKNVIALKEYDSCGDSLEVFQNSDIKFVYIDKMIHEFYRQSYMMNDLLSVMNNHFKYGVIDNDLKLLENDLKECFKKQLGEFFEFDNRYINSIPEKIITNSKIRIDTISEDYVNLFSTNLYNLV
jgi:dCMP deaminase